MVLLFLVGFECRSLLEELSEYFEFVVRFRTLLFDSFPWGAKKNFREAMQSTMKYTNNIVIFTFIRLANCESSNLARYRLLIVKPE